MKKDDLNVVNKSNINKLQKEIDKERAAFEKEKSHLEKALKKKSENTSKIVFVQKKKDEKIELLNSKYIEICNKLSELDNRQSEIDELKKYLSKKNTKIIGIAIAIVAVIALSGVAIELSSRKNKVEQATLSETGSEIITVTEENTTIPTELTKESDTETESETEITSESSTEVEVVTTSTTTEKRTSESSAQTTEKQITETTTKATTTKATTTRATTTKESFEQTFILNTNTHRIHYPDCRAIRDMNPENMKEVHGTVEQFRAEGYTPCGICHPR